MNYYQKAKDIYEMLGQGKMIDAFEKYYHQDVVMVEATGDVRKGKDFNREFEQKFLGSIKEFHGFGVNSITSNETDPFEAVVNVANVAPLPSLPPVSVTSRLTPPTALPCQSVTFAVTRPFDSVTAT